MGRSCKFTRIVLVGLAALLTALPLAESAPPVEAKKRSRTVTRTFGNVVPLNLPKGQALPSPVSAGYYPSDIAVTGLKGTIRDVNVTLNGLSHDWPDDVEVLLVGPGGQTAVVLADVGGIARVEAVTLTLDDEAAAPLPDSAALQSGAFRPTDASGPGEPLVFNAPAPTAGANVALSVFDGGNPNGVWRLFVQDDYGPDESGAIAGGWDLEITTKVKAKKKKR